MKCMEGTISTLLTFYGKSGVLSTQFWADLLSYGQPFFFLPIYELYYYYYADAFALVEGLKKD